jgi:hypothetical protein
MGEQEEEQEPFLPQVDGAGQGLCHLSIIGLWPLSTIKKRLLKLFVGRVISRLCGHASENRLVYATLDISPNAADPFRKNNNAGIIIYRRMLSLQRLVTTAVEAGQRHVEVLLAVLGGVGGR